MTVRLKVFAERTFGEEALRQLDAGELDDFSISSQLRMWRYLLDDALPLAAE